MSQRLVGILVAVASVVALVTVLQGRRSSTTLAGGEPRITAPGGAATPKTALDPSKPDHVTPERGPPSGEVVVGEAPGAVPSAELRSRQAMKQLVQDSLNQGRWTTLHDEAFDTLIEQAPQGLRDELLRARNDARGSRQNAGH